MNSTALVAAATINFSGLLKSSLELDKKYGNRWLTRIILVLSALYLVALVFLDIYMGDKKERANLVANAIAIFFYMILFIYGEKISEVFADKEDKKEEEKKEEEKKEEKKKYCDAGTQYPYQTYVNFF